MKRMTDVANNSSSKNMIRRAQVTIYIIFGLVVLAILGATGYIAMTYFLNGQPDNSLQDYVESCIARVATDGLERLGQHGGMIYPNSASSTLMTSALPAEGDVLIIDDEEYVPYWWYMPTRNDCAGCIVSSRNIPTIESMQDDLAQFVSANIEQCAGGFVAFSEKGYLINTELDTAINTAAARQSSRALFTEHDVLITLDWPLTSITPDGRKTRLNEFTARVDVPMKTIWQNANDLTRELSTTQFMEQTIMNFIASFSDTDFDKLPPIASVTHGSHTITWQDTQVKQTLQSILETYIPLVQVKNAHNFASPYDITFSYLDWPFYFFITPNTDGRLTPEIDHSRFVQDIAPPIQTNYYEFFYDISMPYLITLHDGNALKGEGYSFVIATEANIRDNKNMKEWNEGKGTLGPWTDSRYSLQKQTGSMQQGECSCIDNAERTSAVQRCFAKTTVTCNLNEQTYANYTACANECTISRAQHPTPIMNTQTLFCDETLRTNATIHIRVLDEYTNQSLSDAEIVYGCGSFSSCALDTTNSEGIITSRAPFCYNGHLKTFHTDYYTDTQLFTAVENANLTVRLTPFSRLQMRILVYDMYDVSNRSKIIQSSLRPSEHAVITIERFADHSYATPLVQFMTIDMRNTPTLNLIPGNYSIRAQLIDESGYVLPKKCKMISMPDSPPQFVPSEDLIVRPGIRGGVILDADLTYAVTREMLQDATTIIIPILRQPVPTCIQADGCILPNCVGFEELDRTREFSMMHNATVIVRLE